MSKLKVKLDDIKLEFETPLKIGSKEVTSIVMRQPIVRDMKLVKHHEGEYEQTVNLIANLTGFSVEEIETLPTHIYTKLQEGLEGFL